ncbi:slipin family protein [Nanoarchaeota archaeon]
MEWPFYVLYAFILYVILGLRIIKEYDRGIRFTLGKFTSVMKPGLRIVFPVVQAYEKVDIRVKAVDVPDQEAMTLDNVPAQVNAVIYYKVTDAQKAILEVENFQYAVSQLAQTTMRNVVGETELDQMLANRDEVSKKIKEIIDAATDPWGIKVESVELKDIILPSDMKRVMAKQAEAEREKRAVIIKAQGEVQASQNLAKAAKVLSGSKGALHLRTLHTLNDLSSDQSNTVIFAIPLEVLRAFEESGISIRKKQQ